MRSTLSSTRKAGLAVLAAAALAATLTSTASAPASADRADGSAPAPHSSPRAVQIASETVRRDRPDRTVTFYRGHAGEAFVTATVSARGVSWADPGNESAVVSAYVDGHYATDIVITSAVGLRRQFALGHLAAGKHTLRLHYASRRSPSDAGVARLQQISFWTVRPSSPAYVAAQYAPILYGRDGRTLVPKGGRFENNHTDLPLVGWHATLPAKRPGHSILEYSVVWSNEDGGTDAPALMAQWGRTTDIEWIYRVEVDQRGRRVPGSGEFQGAGHGTVAFRGDYDGTHPILQTCTTNNNVCDAKALKKQKQKPDPMRFALSFREGLPAGQPREHVMDANPWTYQVMAREMVREKKITDQVPDPAVLALADQRTYLYLALDQMPGDADVGLAVDVHLKGDLATYTSDHDQAGVFYSIHRDGPAATTVKLPPGTTPADIESIWVRRVTPLSPLNPTSSAPVNVTGVLRAFFLDRRYLPEPSFLHQKVDVELTPQDDTQLLWAPTG